MIGHLDVEEESLRERAQRLWDEWDNYDRGTELTAWRAERATNLHSDADDEEVLGVAFPPAKKTGAGLIGLPPRTILAMLDVIDAAYQGHVRSICGSCEAGLPMGCTCTPMDTALARLSEFLPRR
jgi:hypothetical protein